MNLQAAPSNMSLTMESFNDLLFVESQEDYDTVLSGQRHGGYLPTSESLVPLPTVTTNHAEHYEHFPGGSSASSTLTLNETAYAIDQHSSRGSLLSDWIDDSFFVDAATVTNPPQQYYPDNCFEIMGQMLPHYSASNKSTRYVQPHIGDDVWNGGEGIFDDGQAAALLPSDHLQHPIGAGVLSMYTHAHQGCGPSPSYSSCTSPDISTLPHHAVASTSSQPLSDQTVPRKSLKRSRESDCSTPIFMSAYSSSSTSTPSPSNEDNDASYSDTNQRPAKRPRRLQISSATSTPKKIPCEDPDCNFSTNASGDLKRHMLSLRHKQVRSFSCKVKGCKKAFTRSDALKRHLATVIHPVSCEESVLEGSASAAKKKNKRGRNGRN